MIESTSNRNDYIGDGGTSIYSYSYFIFQDSELQVTQKDTADVEVALILDTDYTVTGAGDEDGGTIVLTSPLTSDYALTIRRVLPLLQEYDIRNPGDFYAEIHESFFDYIIMVAQQLNNDLARSLRLAETTAAFSMQMPEPEVLSWLQVNAAGTGWEWVTAADLTAILTTVDASLTSSGGQLSVTRPVRYATCTGAVDALEATTAPAPAALVNGLRAHLEVLGANITTTPTLDLNGLGAKDIVKHGDTALIAGDIPSVNAWIDVIFDSSLDKWVLINPSAATVTDVQSGGLVYAQAAGLVNVMTAAYTPTILALTEGMTIGIKVNLANTSTTPTLNIDGLGAKTIKREDGAALLVGDLPINYRAVLMYTGTVWALLNPALVKNHTHASITEGGTIPAGTIEVSQLQTETATTSGTEHDYTSIPSWVKRITVMFVGISTDGTSIPMIQLGDTGGFEASGYSGAAAQVTAAAQAATAHSTGFVLAGTHAATAVFHGKVELTLENSANNTWVISGNIGASNFAGVEMIGGSKSLSAALDRIRLTTVNGTDAFDAGAINVMWE